MAAVKILQLTEDTSKQAPAVQEKLTKLLLRALDSELDTRLVEFAVPPNEKMRNAAKLTSWNTKKSSGPSNEDFRQLLNAIATRIVQDKSFVTFHFDGDRPFSEHEESENRRAFAANVRDRLRELLKTRAKARSTTNLSDDDERSIEQELGRLLPITPFYSIEAWLYQNSDVLEANCRCLASERVACKAKRDEWKRDRSLLDEIRKPKEALCVGDTCNEQLAQSLSNALFQQILHANKSLAATVAEWRSRPALIEALRSLREAT